MIRKTLHHLVFTDALIQNDVGNSADHGHKTNKRAHSSSSGTDAARVNYDRGVPNQVEKPEKSIN